MVCYRLSRIQVIAVSMSRLLSVVSNWRAYGESNPRTYRV